MSPKLSELARLVNGTILGDEATEIAGVAAIDDAGPGEITFLTQPRYRRYLATCRASAIIVPKNMDIPGVSAPGTSYLQVSDPYVAFAEILAFFNPPSRHDGEVNTRATIDPTARLGKDVTIYPHVFVGKQVTVGEGTVLYPGVFLGDRVRVGEKCVLYPHVSVAEACRLGNRVIVHAGVVIGSDGFGYAGEGTRRIKIPQTGIVEVQDDVEIGANTTIDRATLGKTVVGKGTKIDNLVHIAHNVSIGEHSILAGQSGIAGSTRLGSEVILAGQSGVANHLEIGNRARIGPKAGVLQSVPEGATVSGVFAFPHRDWLRISVLLGRLPKLWDAVHRLERQVSGLLEKRRKDDA